jgi:O-antigen ligase
VLFVTSLLFFLAGAFFPISALIKSIFLYPALVLSLFQLDYSKCIKVYKQSRFLSASLLLFILLLLSLFYTVADSNRALSVLLKYRRLLYPLVLLPAFYYFPKLRTYLLKGLCVSCWIIALLIIIHKLDALPIKLKTYITSKGTSYEQITPAFLLVNPIYGSFIVSLVAYFAMHVYLLKPILKKNWFYLSSSLLAGIIILFYQKQNTGLLNYYFLLALLLFQVCVSFAFKKRLLYLLIISLPLVFALTHQPISKFIVRRIDYISFKTTPAPQNSNLNSFVQSTDNDSTSSSNLIFEFQSFFKEITDYFRFNNIKTDQGVRLQLIKTGFQLWTEKPVLGWGVGGYAEAYSLKKWIYLAGYQAAANPHNEFILILVELGFVGIIVFFYWLYSILRDNFHLFGTSLNYYPVYALIGSITIGGFADVILFLNITGDFIIIMICWALTAHQHRSTI